MTNGCIFVVGSLHYDIVLNASHLPARDETVMGGNVQFVCGGKGGNQAMAAAQHGANVSFAGALGHDFFAEALLSNLEKGGVETSQIKRHHTSVSGMSVAIVEPGGDYGAVVASGTNQMLDASAIKVPVNTSYLILQNEIPEDVNIAVSDSARKSGARVILNAAPMRSLSVDLMKNVDVLIVNRVEASGLFQRAIDTKADAITALSEHDHPCSTIIITLGGDGLVFVDPKIGPSHLTAFNVQTVSNHGAGDSFVGALCCQLTLENPLINALKYASAAAALHVSTPVEQRLTIGPTDVEKLL